MTRDEAIEKLKAHPSWAPMTDHAISAFVDGAAIFGLLKLVEPKSVQLQAIETITYLFVDDARAQIQPGDAARVINHLNASGFKIVKA